jgi:lipoprotein NlpD
MKLMRGRQALMVLTVLAACALTACSSRPRGPIPVEDKVAGQSPVRAPQKPQVQSTPVAVSSPVSMGPSLPSPENAGKPGYYSVRPGDTLTKISLDHGQAWRDIARWNGLDNPNLIEVDQVLRVTPPVQEASVARSTPPAKPPVSSPGSTPPNNVASTPNVSADENLVFAWPHPGQVLANFDEAKNKGLDFGGKVGDPVLAAADGKVVYAGSGLRGYGNLVILKHNNTYLSAYAHNQTLLVKEDQAVQKGQRIAEMGSSDADRVKLHFEIRKQGKPVDPAKLLPARP